LTLLGLIALSSASRGAEGASTFQVPPAIAGDCSVDVTQALLSWVASVPDNSVLSFAPGGCYRIEGTLGLRGRSGLVLEGNGATFRSLSPPADQRAMWRVIDSTQVVFRDMTIAGSYAQGGTFTASLEHAHAIDLRGTSVEIANVTMSDVAGDCVYFGLGLTSALTRSSGSVRDSSCARTGRNAVAVAAGNDILVQRVRTSAIGYDVFNVEPNSGPGWGSQRVTFDNNTIGSYSLVAFSIVPNAPVSDQTFSNNHVVGQGLQVAVGTRAFRPSNVTITGNSADTAQAPSALDLDQIDQLTVTGNTVPMSGGPMAAVTGSCNIKISGNSYPNGSVEAVIYPWICSFTPSSGPAGTKVTIIGSGLTGAAAVSFNGVKASFNVDSDAQMTATVPGGASSGPVTVVTRAGTATSSTNFTVSGTTSVSPTSVSPTVSSFTPTSGPVGTTVTITGSGFTRATAVAFNGTSAAFANASDTEIRATVPSGASSGTISVSTAGGTKTSNKRFRVTLR
jgi:hypothetical protein